MRCGPGNHICEVCGDRLYVFANSTSPSISPSIASVYPVVGGEVFRRHKAVFTKQGRFPPHPCGQKTSGSAALAVCAVSKTTVYHSVGVYQDGIITSISIQTDELCCNKLPPPQSCTRNVPAVCDKVIPRRTRAGTAPFPCVVSRRCRKYPSHDRRFVQYIQDITSIRPHAPAIECLTSFVGAVAHVLN